MANSTLTLASLIGRVRAFLVDSGSESFADGTVTEGLRQALADLSKVYGSYLMIKDLDDSGATTVNVLDVDLVVRGAAGYAARMRAMERTDSANLGQSMPSNLLEWSKSTLYWFDDKLKQVKLRLMQQSTANPASLWTWDESDRNW